MTIHNIRSIEHAEVVDLEARAFGPTDVDPKVREACRILKEVRAVLDTDPVAARGHVERLAQVLGATGCASKAGAAHRGGLAPWQERRLREHIAANLCEPLPLSALAALVRLSNGHFARAFRQSFGVSPHTFIIEQRVSAAKRLILESEAPLAEIALSCGMADQSHLTRHFTRRVGMSPAAWRRHQTAPVIAQAA
jgi:AraC-like DNA-binding protein